MDGTFTKGLDSRSGTKMKASGVLSPFFNINNAVKMIPFFGELLGGKEERVLSVLIINWRELVNRH